VSLRLQQVPGLRFARSSAGPFYYVDPRGAPGYAPGLGKALRAKGVPLMSGGAFGDDPECFRLPCAGPAADARQAAELITQALA
jgi:hypothetical protein